MITFVITIARIITILIDIARIFSFKFAHLIQNSLGRYLCCFVHLLIIHRRLMRFMPDTASCQQSQRQRPKQITLRNNRTPAFVPLTGTSDGAYAIRPYPDGQKTETGGVG